MTGWSTGAWGGARRGGRRRKSWSGCWGLFRDKYADFTMKHFHEQLRKRPRRPLPGMLLHQDGSRHAWIEGLPAMDLIVTCLCTHLACAHTCICSHFVAFQPNVLGRRKITRSFDFKGSFDGAAGED